MARKFVSKKRIKILSVLKIIIIFIIIYIVYKITFGTLLTIKVMSSNENFLNYLITDTNHHVLKYNDSNNYIDKLIKFFSRINIKEPNQILNTSLVFENDSDILYEKQYEELLEATDYVSDPNPIEIDNPKIYIYNSHQLETYSNKNLDIYGITPNVMMASYLLKEKLNKIGIPTVVEDSNIVEFMKINDWDHADSYKASRFYLLEALNNYPNLELIIDLHRDALSHENSTININGKDCAKVLFVVGLEHDNYEANLELTNKINDIIKEKYPNLTRGVLKKEGKNVDGIYNQDVSSKMILLELGGNENSIEEVMNTIDIMTEIFNEYVGDENV